VCDTTLQGEISLRGRVTAVGGIKEKLIGALRAGVKTVLLPAQNRKDVKDLPQEVRDGLEIIHVRYVVSRNFASDWYTLANAAVYKQQSHMGSYPSRLARGTLAWRGGGACRSEQVVNSLPGILFSPIGRELLLRWGWLVW